MFEDLRPEVLSHQGAQMNIRRSVRKPDFDAEVNILGTICFIENCTKYDLQKFIFASIGGMSTANSESSRPQKSTRSTPSRPTGLRSLHGNANCTSNASNTGCPASRSAIPTFTGYARTDTETQGWGSTFYGQRRSYPPVVMSESRVVFLPGCATHRPTVASIAWLPA